MRNFEKYCIEDTSLIENYELAKADNFKGWNCHHRMETHNSDGERRTVDITPEELQALGMYNNRPASELIFLTISEHSALHNKGKSKSEDHKRKLSEAHKGKTNPHKGSPCSEEHKRKLSEAKKGKHWYTNGSVSVLAKTCPEGFHYGRVYIKEQ